MSVMPAIDTIANEMDLSLSAVQTAMSLTSIVSVITGVSSAMLIRFGIFSKKTITVLGCASIALTGAASLVFNSAFWHLALFSTLIGTGMGIMIPTAQSIMFDNFDGHMRQFIAGIQSAFLNLGGIIMSTLGGFLTTIVWYGGYLTTLIAVPVVLVGMIFIPKDKKIKPGEGQTRTKLPRKVFFYCTLVFTLATIFNVGPMNISTHLSHGNIGDAATAGIATAVMMAGGVLMGFLFPKVSQLLGDRVLPLAFVVIAIGFTLLNLFHTSLIMTMAAMFLFGCGLSMMMPRCVFSVSNLTDPSNSSLATMMILCVAPGTGSFLSPIIMTNLTYALAGDSTRFRFQFTGVLCILIAAAITIYLVKHKSEENNKNSGETS